MAGEAPAPSKTRRKLQMHALQALGESLVELSAARLEQLDALPGVGPATAQAIIDWRRLHGRFRSVQDLLQVRGIGPAKLAALRPLVRT